jgi:hypothetical protein
MSESPQYQPNLCEWSGTLLTFVKFRQTLECYFKLKGIYKASGIVQNRLYCTEQRISRKQVAESAGHLTQHRLSLRTLYNIERALHTFRPFAQTYNVHYIDERHDLFSLSDTTSSLLIVMRMEDGRWFHCCSVTGAIRTSWAGSLAGGKNASRRKQNPSPNIIFAI